MYSVRLTEHCEVVAMIDAAVHRRFIEGGLTAFAAVAAEGRGLCTGTGHVAVAPRGTPAEDLKDFFGIPAPEEAQEMMAAIDGRLRGDHGKPETNRRDPLHSCTLGGSHSLRRMQRHDHRAAFPNRATGALMGLVTIDADDWLSRHAGPRRSRRVGARRLDN